MPEPWRAETKVYMATERTLINWLRTAATLGLGAAVVNVIGDSTHGGWHSVVVGHAVRGDSTLGATTRVAFVTTGLLLRRLSADPLLACATTLARPLAVAAASLSFSTDPEVKRLYQDARASLLKKV